MYPQKTLSCDVPIPTGAPGLLTLATEQAPSFHDTDVWGILLLQAWPPPTAWATTIAVTITGREAGSPLLLQATCLG